MLYSYVASYLTSVSVGVQSAAYRGGWPWIQHLTELELELQVWTTRRRIRRRPATPHLLGVSTLIPPLTEAVGGPLSTSTGALSSFKVPK